MRRLLCTILLLPFCLITGAQMTDESLVKLDGMLEQYVTAIEQEDVATKEAEVDFLIESSTDSLLRDRIARNLYSHYQDSKLMGEEAVAVHIYDKWFSTGRAHFQSSGEMSDAGMFAEFNRSTLIGCDAPELALEGIEGNPVSAPCRGKRSLLFFYDVDCAKCKMESILLRNYLAEENMPICLYAVYVGNDRNAWEKFAAEQLDVKADKVTTVHAWDPEASSGMHFLYGITQTPRMYLIDKDGKVRGRRLDTESLSQVISMGRIMEELENRAAVGTKVADMKVPGRKLTRTTEKDGVWNLRSFRCVVFYTSGCTFCDEAVSAARMAAAGGDKVLLVNVDEIIVSDKALATRIFDTFDLTHMPLVLHMKSGRIVSKN